MKKLTKMAIRHNAQVFAADLISSGCTPHNDNNQIVIDGCVLTQEQWLVFTDHLGAIARKLKRGPL